MNERDTYAAGREARREVAQGSSASTRHEEALLRYLGGIEYAEQQVHKRADTVRAAPPAAAEPDATGRSGPVDLHEQIVVAAADDSPGSFVALDHAAIEADLRGWPLRVTHVQHPAGAHGAVKHARDRGAALLEEMSDRVRTRAPTTPVTSELLAGATARTLVARTATAGLTVLGSRGRGQLTGLLGGSVSTYVAAHAQGPVLIVRTPSWPPSPEWPLLPVLAGVDDSPAGMAALRFAADEARLRGVPLVVMHLRAADGTGKLEEAGLERAADLRGLSVRRRSPVGDPRVELVEASRHAAAMVVSHGRGGLAGMRLGPVSSAAIRHAHCPVFVIHAVPR